MCHAYVTRKDKKIHEDSTWHLVAIIKLRVNLNLIITYNNQNNKKAQYGIRLDHNIW